MVVGPSRRQKSTITSLEPQLMAQLDLASQILRETGLFSIKLDKLQCGAANIAKLV